MHGTYIKITVMNLRAPITAGSLLKLSFSRRDLLQGVSSTSHYTQEWTCAVKQLLYERCSVSKVS
jgi:hypothetical protein